MIATAALRCATAGVAALLLSACTSLRPPFAGFSGLAPGDVAIVGRIELEPPLVDSDQQVDVLSPYEFKNQIYAVIDDRWRTIQGEPGTADLSGSISAPLGQTFYRIVPSKPLFLLESVVYLRVGKVNESALFPGGLRVDIRPGDRAVYVGTVRYHRNEFMETQRVEVVDAYADEAREFARRFGGDVPLQKRLFQPVTP